MNMNMKPLLIGLISTLLLLTGCGFARLFRAPAKSRGKVRTEY